MNDFIINNKFVAVDLETSGLCEDDYIIEVGAVKIERGIIAEKFSSFVRCPVKLSPDIVSFTKITDELLIDAPTIEEVLKRLHSFCEGCILVAHNLQFDYGFLSKYGERYGIYFDNPRMDTIVMAKARLSGRLKNFKLSTIAEFFGIRTYKCHRALDDAETTAKQFIYLSNYKPEEN